MAGRNGATAEAVEAQVVHDFDALLDEVSANDPPDTLFTFKGTEFSIPTPLKWSDEVLMLQSRLSAVNEDGEQNVDPAVMVSFARELLGGQYARFVELGGSAMRFNRVLPKILGASSVGESSAS